MKKMHVVFLVLVVAVFSEVGWRAQGIREGKAIAKKSFENQQAMKIFEVGDLMIGYTISGETDPETKKAVGSTVELLSLELGRALAAAEAYGSTKPIEDYRAGIVALIKPRLSIGD